MTRTGKTHRVDCCLAVVFFTVLALVLTAPSLFSGGTRVCSDDVGDTWTHMWIFWRTRYALMGRDHGYLTSHVITYPGYLREPMLAFDPLMPLASVPLQYICRRMPTVLNLLVTAGLVFSGTAGYLLTSFVTRRRSIGLVGGVIIGFNPFVYRQIFGGYAEYAWWGFVPLTTYLYLKAVSRPDTVGRAKYIASLLLLLLLSIYCASCFAVIAAFALLLEVTRAVLRKSHKLNRVLRVQTTALLCLVPLLAFWVWNLAAFRFEGLPLGKDFPIDELKEKQYALLSYNRDQPTDPAASNTGSPPHPGLAAPPHELLDSIWLPWRTLHGSLDLADMVNLSRKWSGEHPEIVLDPAVHLPWSHWTGCGYFDCVFGREWLLVLVLCGCAFLGVSRKASNIRWTVLALVFLVFAVGPFPIWNGRVLAQIALPYEWLYKWFPGFSRLNIPARATLGSVLCLAVLATRGTEACAARLGRRLDRQVPPAVSNLGVAVLVFFLFAVLGYEGMSLPCTDVEAPAIYQRIAEERGNFALLELPTVGDLDRRMFCQSIHGKPIFKGSPPTFMDREHGNEAMYDNALVRALDREHPKHGPGTDLQSAVSFLWQQGFRYLIVHSDGYSTTSGFESACSIAESCLGPPAFRDKGVVAWRLAPTWEASP